MLCIAVYIIICYVVNVEINVNIVKRNTINVFTHINIIKNNLKMNVSVFNKSKCVYVQKRNT